MVHRAALLCLVLSACGSTPQSGAPSLAPRAAEAIDPRVPIPNEIIAGPADPALAARIAGLMAEVRAGDAAFQVAATEAERMAAVAGPAQSESWIEAQQAVSALIAARAPVARAISDLDALVAARLAVSGGMLPGDLRALETATAEAGAIGESEAEVIDRLQARLAG